MASDAELLDGLGHAEAPVLGQQAEQGAPAVATVHGPSALGSPAGLRGGIAVCGSTAHLGLALLGHLTDPAVSPPTRCFSMNANRMTTGTMAMMDAASRSQCCS